MLTQSPPPPKGSQAAIEALYKVYRASRDHRDLVPVLEALGPRIMAAARRAGLTTFSAEDVVQETFLGLIKNEGRYDDSRPLVPYVNRIALNQINSEKRRGARAEALIAPGDAGGDVASREPSCETPLHHSELESALRAVISRMSQEASWVVCASIFDGLTTSEIALTLGISKPAARIRLHRGIQRIRDTLCSKEWT